VDRADPDRLLEALDADFGAALTREEDAAAADLAFTLLQDRSLCDYLTRGGPWQVRLEPGREVLVERVGPDVVEAGPFLIPLRAAVLRKTAAGELPQRGEVPLLGRMRALARRRRLIRLSDGGPPLEGRLAHAGRDFVAIGNGSGEVVVALERLEWVQVLEEAR
jgi:hypothetical protein